MAMHQARLTNGFINFGHALDHWVMLIFPTVVLALTSVFGRSYADLLPLSLGGFLAFGLFSLPAGWLGDRWCRRNMMGVFFGGVGGACILAGFAATPWQLAAALTLIGTFAAIYHPVGTAMLTTDQARLGRTLGVNGLWGNLGVAFAALATGTLADWVSWRAAFFVPGVVAVMVGAAFMFCIPATVKGNVKKANAARLIDRALMLRLFAIIAVSTAFGGVIFSATTIAMPKVLAERLAGLITTNLGVGALVCLVFTLAAFAQVMVGPLIDRFDTRRVLLPIALAQVPLLFLAGFAQGFVMLVAAIAMMFAVFGQIPVNDAMIGRYTADEFRARAYALRYLLSFGASATAVPLVALLYRLTGGFKETFMVLSLLAIGTLVAALAFPRRAELAPKPPTAPRQPASAPG